MQHILLATEELALESLHRLRAANIGFSELAAQISACSATREKAGAVGWVAVDEEEHPVSCDDEEASPNAHLDEIFPAAARQKMIQISTKPGDIVMVESSRGFHLVQIVDVMAEPGEA